jgi:predicted NAD/FAD-dependent oxidoreductase
MRIVIIGAGLAGLACARRLGAGGHVVRLFDKGRGPGGRMSTRRVATPQGEAGFDHGAQYFTVRDAGFQRQVEAWAASGVAARWPAAGPDAWVGTPAMNAPVKALAAGLDVTWSAQVDALRREGDGWHIAGRGAGPGAGRGAGPGAGPGAGAGVAERPFDAVLLAIPAEQAGPRLAAFAPEWAALAKATEAEPCWTVMAAFAGAVAAPDVLKEGGPIGWAARNQSKPGRSGPEAWVIQAGPGWSRAHLEETPEQVAPQLLDAFAARTGPLPEVLTASAHRWRYAKSGKAGRGALWDPALRLGVCGDWLLGPRVECAWLSGEQLAAAVLA